MPLDLIRKRNALLVGQNLVHKKTPTQTCPHEGAVLEFCKRFSGEKGEGRHVRDCDKHERCTRVYVGGSVQSCDRCPDNPALQQLVVRKIVTPTQEPNNGGEMKRPQVMKWAYGVTTVPSRRANLLRPTLVSLTAAGFESPHLFVDGDEDGASWKREFGLEVTCHGGRGVRAYGNWVLSLAELYIRNPTATHFAIFQDDFLTYRNLRQYLERVTWPIKSYLNLYTFPQNSPSELRKQDIKAPDDNYVGFYQSNQRGRGAIGLVFRRDAVLGLLTHQHMVERPLDPNRGHKSLDGGVMTTMTKMGWVEMVHNPTLTYHTGKVSAIGNTQQAQGLGFKGAEYDALELLKG